MNRQPNHCACPRCGSRLPQEPSEFEKAVAIAKLKQTHFLREWSVQQSDQGNDLHHD